LSVQSENAGVVNGINQKQYLNAAKNSFVRMNILKPGTLEDGLQDITRKPSNRSCEVKPINSAKKIINMLSKN